jgi:hypothetical protein
MKKFKVCEQAHLTRFTSEIHSGAKARASNRMTTLQAILQICPMDTQLTAKVVASRPESNVRPECSAKPYLISWRLPQQ